MNRPASLAQDRSAGGREICTLLSASRVCRARLFKPQLGRTTVTYDSLPRKFSGMHKHESDPDRLRIGTHQIVILFHPVRA
ncbi:hypothetical protein SBV1_1440026 [Verrucomicrobia bacterium]|nr:hypothetical protein SBV1_1440026 [Verrucomicrobiota bacterium]